MTALSSELQQVTERVQTRSRLSRQRYLDKIRAAAGRESGRNTMGCANLAHAFAAAPANDKLKLHAAKVPNLGVVSAYNDMLSAHQPFAEYPEQIKAAAASRGATAQFAGGTPAMCDGVTQGEPGMELSLFSRDVIAMSTAIALSHDVFDAALCLGVCDKIVPGLFIGALSFGHLPVVFAPAGPMTSGLANSEKAKVRQLFAEGKVDRAALLEAEGKAYHGPGTCTFYGTANSNQMLMEFMGVHLPGAAFVTPGTEMRSALTKQAAIRAVELAEQAKSPERTLFGEMIDERAVINAIVGLLATGGSTNHTMHLVAMARAAGIVVDWDDFSALSKVVPSLTRVYPNGSADVNQFHAAGGLGLVIAELLGAGLLHEDVDTVAGRGLHLYAQEPCFVGEALSWREGPKQSLDTEIIKTVADPVSATGGLQLLDGRLGRSVIKSSAVAQEHRVVRAPAVVFHSQAELKQAFEAGELDRDMVAVVRFQGPRANGMPELHKLTPFLGIA
ncbi:MAG: phosphogluconate dehydratase, partial [Granulosicoccaceae bacterium]